MSQPTMRYSPTNKQVSTPSQKKPIYYYRVFEGDIDSCLDNGWYVHPDDFPKPKEKKVEAKTKPKSKK